MTLPAAPQSTIDTSGGVKAPQKNDRNFSEQGFSTASLAAMTTARGTLNSRPELLASPWLVLSVLVLLVNDWVLKPAFHNGLTGKISDFAGLLALTLVACAVSQRLRWWSASFIAALFVYWKSPYSQPLVSYLSQVLPLGIGRTPDYTDLLALPVVWIAAFYAPRLSVPTASAWTKACIAGFCTVTLTATSYLPQYTIRESGEIPPASLVAVEKTSRELEQVVDRIAIRHGLKCTVCDPIAEGRVYRGLENSLSLLARFDQTNSQLLYEVRTYDVGRGEAGPQQVDAVRAQFFEELRTAVPTMSIARVGIPSQRSISLGVSKRNSFTSYRDSQNQGDIDAAKRVVAEAATSLGLKKYESSDVYYSGGLYGWPPYARELVVSVGVADDPLVMVRVTRSSDRFADMQQKLAAEIERRLKAQFGSDRAGQRCWIFSCYGS